MAQIIPLSSNPQQSFSIGLNVDGGVLKLQFDIYFSEMAQYWLMDIYNGSGNLLLTSIPLITGDWPAANILAQYAYLKIGSAYVINSGQVADDYPSASELGSDFLLLWDDTATS
jgi:hypothetical protein